MVCCIAAAFVFGLFARFFRRILRRPDPTLAAASPPTPRIDVSPREPVPAPDTDRARAADHLVDSR